MPKKESLSVFGNEHLYDVKTAAAINRTLEDPSKKAIFSESSLNDPRPRSQESRTYLGRRLDGFYPMKHWRLSACNRKYFLSSRYIARAASPAAIPDRTFLEVISRSVAQLPALEQHRLITAINPRTRSP